MATVVWQVSWADQGADSAGQGADTRLPVSLQIYSHKLYSFTKCNALFLVQFLMQFRLYNIYVMFEG